jgi:GAF domain-containing protein
MAAPTAVALDRFTKVVGWELDAPVVCLSLVDANRRLLTSSIGVPPPIALLVSWSFARHVVASKGPMLVTDARQDPRVARNPAVRDGVVTAYLGVRLTASDGRAVGTLSVMDPKPRSWTLAQIDFVRRLCDRIALEVEFGTADGTTWVGGAAVPS